MRKFTQLLSLVLMAVFSIGTAAAQGESAVKTKATEMLAKTGVGYPKANASTRAALQALVADGSATDQMIQTALDAYLADTDIQLPEAGKKYAIVYQTKTHGQYYANEATNEETTKIELIAGTTEPDVNATPSLQYEAIDNGDGTFSFKTSSEKYWCIATQYGFSGTWMTNYTTEGVRNENNEFCKVQVLKIANGENVTADNEFLFGCTYLSGYKGYEPGKSSNVAAVAVINETTLKYDGFSLPVMNGTQASAIRLIEIEEPAAPKMPATYMYTSVTPAEGEVTELTGIFVTYTMDNQPRYDWEAPAFGVINTANGEKVSNANLAYGSTNDQVMINIDPIITTPGTYSITVPEGCIGDQNFSNYDDDKGLSKGATCNPEFTLTYTVVEAPATGMPTTFVYNSVTPAEGNVTILDELVLSYPVMVGGFDYNKATLPVFNGNDEEVIGASAQVHYGDKDNEMKVTFNPAISSPGTYKITVPAGTIGDNNYSSWSPDKGESMGATVNPEFTLTYTVGAAPAKPVTVVETTPAAGFDVSYNAFPEVTMTLSEAVTITDDADKQIVVTNYGETTPIDGVSVQATVNADDATKATLVTNGITESGMYSLTIPEGFFIAGDASNEEIVLNYVVNIDPQINILLEKAALHLAKTGVGYPKADAATRTALQALVDNPLTIAKQDLLNAIEAYLADTDIQLPEAGKKYAIVYQTKTHGQFYANETTEEIVPLNADQVTDLAGTPALHYTAIANDNGTYTFQTNAGKYFCIHVATDFSGTWLTDYSSTGWRNENNELSQLEVQKMVPGNKVIGTTEDVFGFVTLYGARGKENGALYMSHCALKEDGTGYQGYSVPGYGSDGTTTAIRLIEIEEPVNAATYIYETVDPAEGNVTELATITVNYPVASDVYDIIFDEAAPLSVKNADNVEVTTAVVDWADYGYQVDIILAETIIEPGTYTITVPEGVVVSQDANEQEIYNPEFTLTYTIGGASETLNLVSISPEGGVDNSYETFPEVTLTFDQAVTITTDPEKEIMINSRTPVMATATATVDATDATIVKINVEGIDQSGMYGLTIPAGFFLATANSEITNETFEIPAYLVEVAAPTELPTTYVTESVEPAEGEVEELSEITLIYPVDNEVGSLNESLVRPIDVLNADQEVVTTAYLDYHMDWNKMILTLQETITTPGTYTITVPEGWIWDQSVMWGMEGIDVAESIAAGATCNPEFTLTYTVAEAGPEAIKDIELLSNEKTYILHNPIEKCYAVFANEKSLNNIWVANEEGSRNFPNGVTLDPNSASSAWMAIKVKGNFYLYNMGAQKYLETRDYIGNGNLSGPATFIKDFKPVTVVTRADGYLAFTTHADDSKSFLCASTSFDEAHAPMANWSSSDPGCVRQFEENPNIAANPAIVEKITYIIEQSLLLNEEAGDIYNLNGIKMQPGSKLEKGVYIKNGKKVVVK